MTEEEKLRRQQFRAELETRTVRFAADVHCLIQNVHGDEFKNFRFQIGKSSTSIGANYHEANRAESVTDFVHKIGIAFKGEPGGTAGAGNEYGRDYSCR